MRRKLGWLMVLALLVGGAAACGDDDDDGGDTGTETTEADGGESGGGESGGGESGGSGNEAIQAYCDSVQEFVDKSEELAADPTNQDLSTELQELGAQLGADAQELAGQAATLSPEEAEEFQACQTEFGSAGAG